jgi:hypothetical protein
MIKKMVVKILAIILLANVFALNGCSMGGNESSSGIVGPTGSFQDAVQECYKLAAETLFYSSDGVNHTAYNRVSGPNEIAGVCTDYAIEFAYYWNEVKDYDILYGKAYLARIPSNGSNFAVNGTSKIRETSGDFGINGNDQESDGVYRDVIKTSTMYNGSPIKHFNQNTKNHMWTVIKHDGNWYDCEPTWWDTNTR